MDNNFTGLNTPLKPLASNIPIYPYQSENEILSSVLYLFWPVLILVGLVSNTVNIVVFLKVGVKDSVSTLLLMLSISDFLFLSIFSLTILTLSFSPFGTLNIPALHVVHFLTFWPAVTIYDYSAYISVFLGVARCACVAMPLRFKSVFTVKRTVAALLVLFLSDVLLHLPILTVFRLGWVRDPSTNTTSLSLVRDSFVVHVYKQKINDVLNEISIPWVTFIIAVSSVALLSFKLFESSKVRSSSFANNTPNTYNTRGKSTELKQTNSHKLSSKDVAVVQSVILVCSIFIVAQLPSLIYTQIRSSSLEFNERGRLRFLASIYIKVSWTFYMINASVNIIVYYNYNNKFKSVFRSQLHMK